MKLIHSEEPSPSFKGFCEFFGVVPNWPSRALWDRASSPYQRGQKKPLYPTMDSMINRTRPFFEPQVRFWIGTRLAQEGISNIQLETVPVHFYWLSEFTEHVKLYLDIDGAHLLGFMEVHGNTISSAILHQPYRIEDPQAFKEEVKQTGGRIIVRETGVRP